MRLKKYLHDNHDRFNTFISELNEKKFIERIIEKDFTLWSNSSEEITNRLDWLFSPDEYINKKDELLQFAKEVKNEGFKYVLLLGMGGSSLAPEVYQQILGNFEGFPKLYVLDSTHPEQILETESKIDLTKTVIIVSTKSGGTVETLSLMKYFYNKVKEQTNTSPGKHFIAVTDPGSSLETIASNFSFRKIFLNNPNIGGRFSALSYFGLVPAALIGTDLKKLLSMAKRFSEEIINIENYKENNALILGTFLGLYAKEGRDKLTLISSEKLKPVTAWIEQLIAESTGKLGQGILPVDAAKVEIPAKYARDRIFVYSYLHSEDSERLAVENLKRNGFPVVEITLDDIYELGALFYLWEFATAVAGYFMGINPFDQPDVESAKKAARAMTKEYLEKGELPEIGEGVYFRNTIFYPNKEVKPLRKLIPGIFCKISECLDDYLGRNYVALQAFLTPTEKNKSALAKLEEFFFDKYNVAVTIGFGPRFLHSTGQLHKGDGGNGLFIQFCDRPKVNLPIPDELDKEKSSMSFDVLVTAQSLGDRQALLEKGRKILRVEIEDNLEKSIDTLINFLNQ